MFDNHGKGWYKYIMKTYLILFMFLGVMATQAIAEIDMATIARIESSNNPNAVSCAGAKYGRGLYQVSEILLKEYNQFNKTNYVNEDLFNASINESISKWYLSERIPQMLRHFKKPVNNRNILISYNAGINYVVSEKSLPKETRNYLMKYEVLSNETL